jgi:hypothetical protein
MDTTTMRLWCAPSARSRLRTTAGEPGDFDAGWDTDGVDLDEIDPVFLDLSDANAEGPVTAHPATALR